MKKILKLLSQLVIIVFIFFLITVYFLSKQAPSKKPSTISLDISPSITQVNPSLVPISSPIVSPIQNLLSQLSTHNNINSCWFVIDGNLYDVTPYFGSHPGGDRDLLKYCGQDATSGFHTKNKVSAVDHSAAAKAELQQYLIQ